jgi:hypothetical protein
MPPGGDNICEKSSQFHFVNEYLYKPVNLEEYQQKTQCLAPVLGEILPTKIIMRTIMKMNKMKKIEPRLPIGTR